jgi:hypothetical protein
MQHILAMNLRNPTLARARSTSQGSHSFSLDERTIAAQQTLPQLDLMVADKSLRAEAERTSPLLYVVVSSAWLLN